MQSRRVFLKHGAFALVSLGFAPSFLARAAAQVQFPYGEDRRGHDAVGAFHRASSTRAR